MERASETKKLVKTYGEGRTKVEALKAIDLSVNKGELLAIMGPSGSGKTTLLMILGLVTAPSEGQLILDGDNIYNGSTRDLQRLRREKIGFIFQFSNLIPFLTAEENISLPMDLIGTAGGKAHSRAVELLDYLEVTGRAGELPERLSGGERQRVAIARALARHDSGGRTDRISGYRPRSQRDASVAQGEQRARHGNFGSDSRRAHDRRG